MFDERRKSRLLLIETLTEADAVHHSIQKRILDEFEDYDEDE